MARSALDDRGHPAGERTETLQSRTLVHPDFLDHEFPGCRILQIYGIRQGALDNLSVIRAARWGIDFKIAKAVST